MTSMIDQILDPISLPQMVRIRQIFDDSKIENIPSAVIAELERPEIRASIQAGMRICLTAGSRGVANIALILKVVAEFLIGAGADPFIIPAMGSHGGATAEGQKNILEEYNITQSTCGCEIISCMDTVEVGKTDDGQSIFIDKHAASADGIIVIGRIKPHPSFRGPYESGIMKMMAIGLGKQYGAQACHSKGFKCMADRVPMFGKAILDNCNVLFGLGLVENAFDNTCIIQALTPSEIISDEPALLRIARDKMATIKFETADILVVDQIGKNISGDGMDPNVTGTFATPYASGGLQAERVVVLDLTDESHGNSSGLGMADTTTDRAYKKVDPEMTYPNGLTAMVTNCMKVPMHFRNDSLAIKAAVKTCIEGDTSNLRMIRIKDTLHLEDIWISEAMLEEAKQTPGIIIMGSPEPLTFDSDGNLSNHSNAYQ